MDGPPIWHQKRRIQPWEIIFWMPYFAILPVIPILTFHLDICAVAIISIYLFVGTIGFLFEPRSWKIYPEGIQLPINFLNSTRREKQYIRWDEIISIGPMYIKRNTGFGYLHGIRLLCSADTIYTIDFSTDRRIDTLQAVLGLIERILMIPGNRNKYTNKPFFSDKEKQLVDEMKGKTSWYGNPVNFMAIGFALIFSSTFLVDKGPGFRWVGLIFLIAGCIIGIAGFLSILVMVNRKKQFNMVKGLEIQINDSSNHARTGPIGVISFVDDKIQLAQIHAALGQVRRSLQTIVVVFMGGFLAYGIIGLILASIYHFIEIYFIIFILVGILFPIWIIIWADKYANARDIIINAIRLERKQKQKILPEGFEPDRLWEIHRNKPVMTESELAAARKFVSMPRWRRGFLAPEMTESKLRAIHEWELDTGDKIIPDEINYSPELVIM